jgi:Bacterial TniB protein
MNAITAEFGTLSHLLPNAADVARSSDSDRLDYIALDRWLPYRRAIDISQRLDDLVRMPRVNRMPCLLIVGRSNNGKSHILERFAEKFPAEENLEGPNIKARVLLMETPPRPDEVEIYRQLLRMLNRYHRVSKDRGELRTDTIKLLRDIGVKVLVLDEVNYAMASTPSHRESFFNGLRYLTNELRISIVLAGTDKALQLVNADPQIASRFQIEPLPLWKVDAEFRTLLANFEQVLPLREPSHLSTKALASLIHSCSDGTIGSVSELLNAAAKWAITSGKERIDEAAILNCAFVPLDDRKRLIRDV